MLLRHGLVRLLVGLAICVAAMPPNSNLHGQQPVSGLRPILPIVPKVSPRAIRTDGDLDLTVRPDDDQESVTSFLKNVQGQDAVIEVIVGRGRLLTLDQPIAQPADDQIPVVAVGDPSVVDLDILPNPRMIRLLGRRVGITDLSIVTADGKALSFEVHVNYDLPLLQAYLRQLYPDAPLNISQIYDHVVLEGQARNTDQVDKILQTVNAYLSSSQISSRSSGSRGGQAAAAQNVNQQNTDQYDGQMDGNNQLPAPTNLPGLSAQAGSPSARIINLIRVPGTQQIMLKVQIAELNRTALREIGADLFIQDGSGNTFGTKIAGAAASLAGLGLGNNSTAFALFPSGQVDLVIRALRQRQVLSVLAEPNLVAMNGQEASFLAGGEFPVPVPQSGAATGAITIQYKQFGVQLNFVPDIIDDGLIRLRVAPEVSTIDAATGTTVQGTTVPGIVTRRVQTSVEMRQGQTLALAGLLQVTMDGTTKKIPGLGDLPYVGGLFSNTTHSRQEKELIVLVSPFFVDSMDGYEVGPLPGSEVTDPNDREFYWQQKIEGSPQSNFRSPTMSQNPLAIRRLLNLESQNVSGPYGFSR